VCAERRWCMRTYRTTGKTEVCWWQPGNERTLVTPLFSFRFSLTILPLLRIVLYQIIL
jgi:hypothetical protein